MPSIESEPGTNHPVEIDRLEQDFKVPVSVVNQEWFEHREHAAKAELKSQMLDVRASDAWDGVEDCNEALERLGETHKHSYDITGYTYSKEASLVLLKSLRQIHARILELRSDRLHWTAVRQTKSLGKTSDGSYWTG